MAHSRKYEEIKRRLKSLPVMEVEFGFIQTKYGEWKNDVTGWFVNDDMVPKFGDGKFYAFKRVFNFSEDNYTHSHDGYLYNESWFTDHREIKEPVIRLDLEDFLI